MRVDEVLGGEHVGLLDCEHLIDDLSQSLERELDPIASIDRDVAVQDLLEDLAAGDQAPSFTGEPLDHRLGVNLVGMLVADQVHRDVCVDEDHASPAPGIPASISAKRPASVSASIVSISTSRPPLRWLTALRTAASLASTSPLERSRSATRSAWRTHSETLTPCACAVRR